MASIKDSQALSLFSAFSGPYRQVNQSRSAIPPEPPATRMGSLVGAIVPIKPRAVKDAWSPLDYKCNVSPSMNFGTRMPFCDMIRDIPVWLR